jgi:hypothetical protein
VLPAFLLSPAARIFLNNFSKNCQNAGCLYIEAISQMGADGAARDFGRPQSVRREHPRRGAVTDEQRRGRAKDPLFGSIFHLLAFHVCLYFFRLTPLRAFMRWLLRKTAAHYTGVMFRKKPVYF